MYVHVAFLDGVSAPWYLRRIYLDLVCILARERAHCSLPEVLNRALRGNNAVSVAAAAKDDPDMVQHAIQIGTQFGSGQAPVGNRQETAKDGGSSSASGSLCVQSDCRRFAQ